MFVLYLCSLLLRSLMLGLAAAAIAGLARGVALRHAVWAVALACLAVMPVADVLLPELATPAAVPQALSLPIQTFIAVPVAELLPMFSPAAAASPQQSKVDFWSYLVVALVVPALALLLRQSWAMLQVLRLKRTSRRIDGIPVAADFPAVMESGAITTPMTAGLLKPAILLPCNWRNWDEWKLRAVLVHEHCHVLRGDWAVAVAAAFIRCVFWFNPLVWWIERRLSLLAEHACDEASVCRLGDAPRYAETLLDFASSLKHERRWIGGVAMAQHRISRRINRVLTLRTFDSGLVPRAAWIVISVLALPVMYFSAVSPQAARQNIPSLTTMEMLNAVRNRLPQIPDIAMAQTPQQAPAAPAATPQSRAAEAGTPQTPTTPQTPAVNPDLVKEIRLILAPANAQASEVKGEVELTLERGTNRYTGGVVWNTNPGVNTWNTNQGASFWKAFSPNMLSPGFWDQNTSLLLVLRRVEGRAVTFQTGDGRGFTFGCPDCSFHVGESGVGAPNQGSSGIVFRLSADGLSMTATCRAAECRMGTSSQAAANPAAGRFPGVSFVTLQAGQSISFGVHTSTANPPQNRVCFSVFGAVKADGSPFTAADCPDGAALLPEAVLFTFTR